MNKFFKNILPRTLFGRSLLILVIPVFLIQVVTVYVFFDRHWSGVTNRLSYAVAGEISVLADEVERDPDGQASHIITAAAQRALDMHVTYRAGKKIPAGQIHNYDALITRTLDRALNYRMGRPHTIKVAAHEKWVTVDVQLRDGVAEFAFPQGRLFSSSGYIFLMWMIGVSLLLLGVAIIFMRNQIRPIRRLAVAAERFGRGQDVPASFKPEGAHEVRQAARAFIDMHDRIRRQIQQRTAMLAGVSHDLRTPLTRMKLQTAMMGESPDIEALQGDIVAMERMIDGYLNFARGEGEEQMVRTDLSALLENVASNARREGAQVALTAEPDLSLPLRPVAFERALSNIVSNARHYASHIWIGAARAEDALVITVDDNGPGIAEDQFEEVFKPFVRGDKSRNAATGGVGLGLPIAQGIIHAHGGKIKLERSGHGGLRAVISLPV